MTGGRNGTGDGRRESLEAISAAVIRGERIGDEDARALLDHAPLTELGALADLVRRRKHPDRVVSYIVDRNVNYTNVCNAFCTFCAFYRAPGHEEGYVLSAERIEQKIRETYELGGNQILLQGGHNPKLKIDYYEDLFRRLKRTFPDLWLHALSPPEIVHVHRASRIPMPEAVPACARPASIRFPAVAPRSSSTACAGSSPPTSARPTSGWA